MTPRAFVAGGSILLLSACQTYEPRPLDLEHHAADWRARSTGSETVRAFADRLAADDATAAAAFDPADGLSMDEGEIIALVYNADLRLARERVRLAGATAEFADLWDDPKLDFEVLNVVEDVPDEWILGVGLAITIPISGRLEAEKQRAEAGLHAALDRVAEEEWAVRRRLRGAWVAWSASRLRLDEMTELVSRLDSIVGSTTRLADAGEMVRTEAALFTIEQTSRRGELFELRAECDEAEQRLRTIMGLSPVAPLELIPTMHVSPPDADAGDDEIGATNLTLARLRAEYDLAEATLDREIRKQYPDLTIGPRFEEEEGQSRIGFMGGIPIPVLNANRSGIAEAEAEREIARAAFETRYEQLVGELAAARARLRGVRERRGQIERTLIPLVDRQVDDAQRLLDIGEVGGLVLLASIVRAHDAKLSLIEMRTVESLAISEIVAVHGPDPTRATIPNPIGATP